MGRAPMWLTLPGVLGRPAPGHDASRGPDQPPTDSRGTDHFRSTETLIPSPSSPISASPPAPTSINKQERGNPFGRVSMVRRRLKNRPSPQHFDDQNNTPKV